MADRTSAALFGEIFEMFAESEQPDLRIVKRLWVMTRGYDFSACQMDVDDALMKLGLAKVENALLSYANSDASGWEDE
jgi:hypothetical protein